MAHDSYVPNKYLIYTSGYITLFIDCSQHLRIVSYILIEYFSLRRSYTGEYCVFFNAVEGDLPILNEIFHKN